MITVPQPTVEKPLTVIDYIAALEQCTSVTEVKTFGEHVPITVRHDDRFTRAVADKLAAINRREKQ